MAKAFGNITGDKFCCTSLDLLSETVPITAVSKILSHANHAITMSIYAHELVEDLDQVKEAMASIQLSIFSKCYAAGLIGLNRVTSCVPMDILRNRRDRFTLRPRSGQSNA